MRQIVWIALGTISALYAWTLDRQQGRDRPEDWRWLQVIIGVGLCLSAPYILARLVRQDRDWHRYERNTWQAFVVGGIPIIVWQVWRLLARQTELREFRER